MIILENRLAELRKSNGLTLKALADALGLKDNTLSQYETGKREPKIAMWERLAEFFEVPTPYLMGLSDDPLGWKQWEKQTGFSRKQIQDEITRLLATHHLTGNEPYYSQIGIAVIFLNGDGETDTGVKRYVDKQLQQLLNDVRSQYEDPQKIMELSKNHVDHAKTPAEKSVTIGQLIANVKDPSSIFFDDMDADVYNQISEIISNARKQIASIETK